MANITVTGFEGRRVGVQTIQSRAMPMVRIPWAQSGRPPARKTDRSATETKTQPACGTMKRSSLFCQAGSLRSMRVLVF